MTKHKYPKKFNPLFKYKRTGLMRTEEYMHPYLELGFDEEDIALLAELVFDEEIASLSYNEKAEGKLFAPVHAVMVLAKLEAKEPFERLMQGLEIFHEDDDYFRSALMFYLKKVGKAFSGDLISYFMNAGKGLYNRMLVLEALEKIIETDRDDSLKEAWEEALVAFLEREEELNDGLNAFAIFALVDITEVKHIGLIRKVFASKPVDLWCDGDLEELEIRLGLRSQRSTPLPRNEFGVPLGGWDDEEIQPYISDEKVGRNDPCPCGSGKKYKKCCMK